MGTDRTKRPPTITVAFLLGLGAFSSPGTAQVTASMADVQVAIRLGSVTGPDSILPGWSRLRVEEDGGGHILVVFRLPETATAAEVAAFLAALDTAPATPKPGVALGGPEVGNSGDVVIQFTPGRYVLGCVRRGAQGHRHASTGEAKVVVVPNLPVRADRAAPPTATQQIRLVDFAYVGPDRWPAGTHMLRVENGGAQEHQLRLARMRPGSSLQDWMTAEEPGTVATVVAGVARMGSGAVAYLPVELQAGTYVAYCLITDPATGKEHVQMGMFRAIQVE